MVESKNRPIKNLSKRVLDFLKREKIKPDKADKPRIMPAVIGIGEEKY
jgi:uncharacterized protein YabE (DUF348 family)